MLSSYKRKQITKEFPRPDVESASPQQLLELTGCWSEEPKRIQDQILGVVDPLSMAFKHVSSWQSNQDGVETITIPSSNINGLYACLTKALCLLGSINNQLTTQR